MAQNSKASLSLSDCSSPNGMKAAEKSSVAFLVAVLLSRKDLSEKRLHSSPNT